MKGKLMLGIMLATCFSVGATEHSQLWGYKGQESPEHWGKLSPDFALC